MKRPVCSLPNCTNLVESSSNGGWRQHCSVYCKNKHNSIKGDEKRKATCIERFGAVSNLCSTVEKDKIKRANLDKYGVNHPMKSETVKSKVKETTLMLYGVDNVSKLETIKDQKRSTSLKNFGETHHSKTTEGKRQRVETCVKKYGVSHFSKTDKYKEKYSNTSLKKFGTTNPSQSAEVKEKISNTMKRRYGCKFNQLHISKETLSKLDSQEWLIQNAGRSYADIANELTDVTYYTVAYAFEKYGIEHTFEKYSISSAEMEIAEFLDSFGINYETNSRRIIPPKELDIFIPSMNIAIEHNGLYWHSENGGGKPKSYHIDKTVACKNMGIKLVQIWDIEWKYKKDLVKGRLLAMFGKANTLFARSCSISEVTDKVLIRDFLNKNHIQGWCPSSLNYGLFSEGELVSLMTFGKSRFTKGVEWELLRFCNKVGIRVQGGASRMFKHFVSKSAATSIVSYSDLRWNSGNLYNTLGFTLSHISKPNYFYTKNYTTMENRVTYQKHKLKDKLKIYDGNLSETQNMFANGYDRVWDCGNEVWIYRTTSGAYT